MSWLKNLFKSKKSKQAIDVAAEEEFRRIIESFKERIEGSKHAPNKTAHPAGTKKVTPAVKKPVAKKPVADKPVAKKATTAKAPATKKPAPKKK